MCQAGKTVCTLGEARTEIRLLAQSIHNAGERAGGSFISVSCDGTEGEAQREMIFGHKGAAVRGEGGSLLIKDVCFLTRENQYRLFQLIRYKALTGVDVTQYPKADVRVMVATQTSLARFKEAGNFREDLCYLLEGLTVQIPTLRERPEDLEWKLSERIRDCCDNYSRYHVWTKGAKQLLLAYERGRTN